MMASVQAAGHTIQAQPEGPTVVVNTCGFLQSAARRPSTTFWRWRS
ncbi:MAG: hypothetical protein ACLTYN_06795 [Dysosmobacter welbionis]